MFLWIWYVQYLENTALVCRKCWVVVVAKPRHNLVMWHLPKYRVTKNFSYNYPNSFAAFLLIVLKNTRGRMFYIWKVETRQQRSGEREEQKKSSSRLNRSPFHAFLTSFAPFLPFLFWLTEERSSCWTTRKGVSCSCS